MAPAHSKLKAKANYFGGEPIIVERQYVQGMTAALGQFGFIGIAAIYHAHPSLKGIHSPEGSTGWRVSIQIELPCGKKKVVHTAIFHSDYEAAVMLEMCRLWRRKFNKNYGGKNNDAVIQVARDDAAASLPDDADTWELLHDYQEDTFVSDLSWGAVPMRGVCTQPNLYQGRGGYVAFFSGSVNGVRQRQHLGNWPKHTEDGLKSVDPKDAALAVPAAKRFNPKEAAVAAQASCSSMGAPAGATCHAAAAAAAAA